MRERPILFSAPMVRAILAGRKTQTRRIVKPQPLPETDALRDVPRENRWYAASATINDWGVEYRPLGTDQQHDWRCPYGVPGDELWVRETWRMAQWGGPIYRADKERALGMDEYSDRHKWKPAIHLRREHSRIQLRITSVRVQRLQEITEGDAICEGVTYSTPELDEVVEAGGEWFRPARNAFRELWDSINAERAPWASNPWVWVVAFERIRP